MAAVSQKICNFIDFTDLYVCLLFELSNER